MTIKINNLETFLNADDNEYIRDILDFEPSPIIKCEECNEEAYYYSPTKYICVDCGIEITV